KVSTENSARIPIAVLRASGSESCAVNPCGGCEIVARSPCGVPPVHATPKRIGVAIDCAPSGATHNSNAKRGRPKGHPHHAGDRTEWFTARRAARDTMSLLDPLD